MTVLAGFPSFSQLLTVRATGPSTLAMSITMATSWGSSECNIRIHLYKSTMVRPDPATPRWSLQAWVLHILGSVAQFERQLLIERTMATCPVRIRPPAPGDDWIHEPKWDGFRFQVIKDGAGVRFYSRLGAEYTEGLPAWPRPSPNC